MSTVVPRVGRYTIEQVIGTGAFATVYRAVDERLGATVAVKLLADNHCLDPDIRARFIDEGRALRRIDSPHVLRVYDVGETERLQPYLVLEHADRGTLAQRVAGLRSAGWRPSADDVRALASGLAAAVTAVHAADLVHRDLSPGNVLLRSGAASGSVSGSAPGGGLVQPGERLLVADLGLSKDLARNSGLTAAGGTDGFRPPEQRGGPSVVDGRADVWGLSAVLLWLVTGRAPGTDSPSPSDVDRALLDLGLPVAVRPPLLTGLHDDPGRRHPDAATWLAAVESALTPPSLEPADAGPSLRRRTWVAAAALLLGAVVGAGAMRLIDDGGTGEVPDRAGDAALAIVGPAQADVGATVTFEVTADGVDHWAWLMPDGTVYADRPSVQLRTRSAGTAQVVVVGVADSGERLEAVHDLRLVEP